MIIGLGCDIAKVERFSKGKAFIERFLRKYFTQKEQKEIQKKDEETDEKYIILNLATRFSAKEAVAKALGSGFRDGITLKDIEILHDELGCPHVTLYKEALTRAYFITHNQQFQIHISLSNEQEFVNTVAVIETI